MQLLSIYRFAFTFEARSAERAAVFASKGMALELEGIQADVAKESLSCDGDEYGSF
jgi:hypothetical protein